MADNNPASGDAIVQIYEKLNELFGNKASQLFVMEYPGRVLDIGTYAFEGSDGNNAQQIKPQSVVEAEFRLSDDLFSLGEITGGPNGAKFSQIYDEILNSLVPNGSSANAYETKILPDQDLIAEWLVDEVPDWIPPPTDVLSSILPPEVQKHIEKPKKASDESDDQKISGAAATPTKMVPRIDVYQKLLDAYEEENFRWKQFLLNARPKNDNDAKAWDLYNRTVAIYGPVVEKKLQALWTTLIVRGNYHRVRHYIGLVDVESASESLLAAKSSMRESVMRSIDQTQDIYPVHFSPSTWANYLTTDFEPIDLLMDPKVQRTHLFELQEQRRSLLDQKALLESVQPGNDQVKKLEGEMNKARSEYTRAQNEMNSGYTDTTLSLIQMFFRKFSNPAEATDPTKKAVNKASLNTILSKVPIKGKPPVQLSDADFDKFAQWQDKSAKLQSTLIDASESYSRVAGQLAGAKASDNALAILQISRRIDALTDTIEELKRVLGSVEQGKNVTGFNESGAEAEDATVGTKADGSALPPAKLKSGASMWQTVTISGSQSGDSQSSSLTTSSEISNTSVDFWFGGYRRSSRSASAKSGQARFWYYSSLLCRSSCTQKSKSYNLKVDIAFNVMKVTMTRPWFNASVLQNTKGFYRITGGKKISADTKWAELSKETAADEKKKAFNNAQNNSVLPAYPVAFLVAKDVTISITNLKVRRLGRTFRRRFLKGSSDSHSTSHSSYATSSGKFTSIRMPGPQVLGWFMQAVPVDETNADYTPFDPKTLPKRKGDTK
ncbi:hypothetical protein B0H19DRAFT_1068323 [Mycena capillaripes]|nr:hypothetical protein B0H19DRAFT_1068323 [Mycena capillaripes]